MAEGTIFLAVAYVAMIGIIAGWTWRMLTRLVELSGRLEAVEAAMGRTEEE